MGRLWLIGGTQESRHIAEAIASRQFPCTVTVTTEAARSLYQPSPWLRVSVGILSAKELDGFLQQQEIVAVVDASHPYAVEISRSAIAAATYRKIPYLRYERPNLKGESEENRVIEFASFAKLLQSNTLDGRRVLLTVGAKSLSLFSTYHDRATLFARILPTLSSLQIATEAGFSPQRLIALRPPISPELERALWQQWQISLVVTKASGRVGGEETKRAIAAQLRIPLIVMTRPPLTYPQQTSEVEEVLNFCRQSFLS